MGWLDAIPDNSKESRRKQYGKDSPYVTVEPEIGAQWFVSSFIQAGVCGQNGFGIEPLSWGEIESYLNSTGQSQDYFLADSIRNLSLNYVDEFKKAAKPERFSPLQQFVDQQEIRKVVSKQFHDFLKAKGNK